MLVLDSSSVAADETAQHPQCEPAAGEKFISFEIGDRLFCVAAASVQEVVYPTNPAAVPRSPAWLLGLITYRGEPVALLQPEFISGHSEHAAGRSKFIVFHSVPTQTRFALPINSLREMITVDVTAFVSGGTRPFGTAGTEFVHEGRPIVLIECPKLFDSFEADLS